MRAVVSWWLRFAVGFQDLMQTSLHHSACMQLGGLTFCTRLSNVKDKTSACKTHFRGGGFGVPLPATSDAALLSLTCCHVPVGLDDLRVFRLLVLTLQLLLCTALLRLIISSLIGRLPRTKRPVEIQSGICQPILFPHHKTEMKLTALVLPAFHLRYGRQNLRGGARCICPPSFWSSGTSP